MLHKLIDYIVLPAHVSDFEVQYLRRINRIALWFFALHVPALCLVAYANQTNPGLALLLGSLVCAGPWLAYKSFENVRWASLVYGFTAMLMGGLLVHFGQGPAQIEMHFYFFALLAMLAVFGNPLAIVVAAVTVALHHLALWAWLPKSVFNYEAPIWVVLVHAAFVVLESVATCFIARSFFDNVIGLEKIVQARTAELGLRNRDMRLVLDNASQGFLTIDRDGRLSPEQSLVLSSWFGKSNPDERLSEYLGRVAPGFATEIELGWSAVIEDILPLELTLDQLPKQFRVNARYYRVDWTPILSAGVVEKALVMVSDVSADRERERLEAEQRDVLQILGRVAHDKRGVLEYFDEARELVSVICDKRARDLDHLRRALHTLKGNSMIFGVQTIAETCHALEDQLRERDAAPGDEALADLRSRWDGLCRSVSSLLGTDEARKLEIDDAEYEAILHALLRGEPHAKLAEMVRNWKLEPTRARLARVAEQAQGLARRLGKGALRVHIADHGLRMDAASWAPFWSAFVHVVRNAVDHGLEPGDVRLASGKLAEGSLDLSTRLDGDELVIEIGDDGRGIDWAALAEAARARGLACATREEHTEALFVDGVSTRRDVNEYSGRGVGMGAMRSACTERGGRMQVHSQLGAGTRVEFRFPQRALAPSPQLKAAS